MIRSMFSAISGLRNHQTFMDVVGNNISNVNTTGFKSSTVVFQDVLLQTLRGAGAPSTDLGNEAGGTNPAQVGLGSKIAAITTNFAQGAIQRTGRPTDMAIQGDGFFNVVQAGQSLFTRSGAFSVDALGRLVTQEGAFVQGWPANATGAIDTNQAVGNVIIPVGSLIAPTSTELVTLGGNLPSDAPINTAPGVPPGSEIVTSVVVYDTQGNAANVTFTLTHTAVDTWLATATVPDPANPGTPINLTVSDNTFTFDANGELTAPLPPTYMEIDPASFTAAYPTFAAETSPIQVDLGAPDGSNRVTQYASVNSLAVLAQDGFASGSLQSFTMSQEGLIVGSYSNGRTQALAQLALAVFANPEGLEKVGGSNYRATVNSGLAQLGVAGLGGRGLLSSGTLEMSNVDLAQEFTNLIVAQRGFQANSRVVTSSDELLQEIVNMKR